MVNVSKPVLDAGIYALESVIRDMKLKPAALPSYPIVRARLEGIRDGLRVFQELLKELE